MTAELQPDSSQQEIPSPPPVSAPLPSQPQKSRKGIWIILGTAVAVLCLCSIALVALFGTAMVKVYSEIAPVESVLDDYMGHMTKKQAESAYALFSPRAQRRIAISEVQDALRSKKYLIFEGYQSLSVSKIDISSVAGQDPDTPKGTVAKVKGVISFNGGIQGSFAATLEKVDGKWMIYSITVTAPPEKFQ